MENGIEVLRKFFRLSNATFAFHNDIQLIFNGKIVKSRMQHLHQVALEEIEKDNPDMKLMDAILEEMELEAEKFKK
jgi:hypothetical protein